LPVSSQKFKELMSGNLNLKWFALAPIVLFFLAACASTGTHDNASSETLNNTYSLLQINTSEVKLEGEEPAKCEWERGSYNSKNPGEVEMECNDYSGEPRVQGYELCPPGWHDEFVAGVFSEEESRNKEQVRSGICVNNTTESRQCKAGRGCRRVIRYEQCLWEEINVYLEDSHGEGASWYPCEK